MAPPPKDAEIQRRIEALLKTPGAGRAVAGRLRDQSDAWAHRASIGELHARRLEARRDILDGCLDPEVVVVRVRRQVH